MAWEYRLYLTSLDKTELCQIDYISVQATFYLNEYDELTFSSSYLQNGIFQTADSRFELISGFHGIKLQAYEGDTLKKTQYFVIVDPTVSYDGGITSNTVKCMEMCYIAFNKKRLRGYSQPSQTLTGVLTYISATPLLGSWSVGTLPSWANTTYRTMSFDDSTLTDAYKQLEEMFNVFIMFDNSTNTISAYEKSTYGDTVDLVLSSENLINSISHSQKFDQIISKLYCYGTDGIGISSVNIDGNSYITDLSWFADNGYMSSGLLGSYNVYNAKVASYAGAFSTLLSTLTTQENDLLSLQNDLINLQTQNAVYETQLAAYKNAYPNETAVPGSAYATVWASNQTVLGNITTKEWQITSKEADIAATQASIQAIITDLAYSNNYTPSELAELSNFIQEDVLTVEGITEPSVLLAYGQQYISARSQPLIEIDVDSVDLFAAAEFQGIRASFDVGDSVYFDVPTLKHDPLFDYGTLQIVSYTYNPIDNKLTFRLSNSSRIESSLYYLNDIFIKANATATEVKNNSFNWNEYIIDRPNLLSTTSTINAENNEIQAGEMRINRWGFRGDDIGGGNSLEYQKDKIIALRNDGENFDTLLSSNGLALYNANRTSRTIITPGDAYGKFGGLQMDKYVTAATPYEWSSVLWASSEGDLNLTGRILFQGDENQLILDQWGVPAATLSWDTNRLVNTSAMVAQTAPITSAVADFAPAWWDGCTSSVNAIYMDERSFRVTAGSTMVNVPESTIGRTYLNPTWRPSYTSRMRLSWWAKGGQAQVRIYDQTNASYFTINKSNEVAATPVTTLNFDAQTEWGYNGGEPDSVWFDTDEVGHSGCVDIRVQIKNIGATDMYVSGPQCSADRNEKWAGLYKRGAFSTATSLGVGIESSGTDSSFGGTLGNLYVETDFPTNAPNKSVLVDTDDWSRYDKKDISTTTVLTVEDNEHVRCAGSSNYSITLHTGATTSSVIKYIINIGTGLITVVGTISGQTNIYLYPGESCLLATNGTNWDQIG